MYLVGVHRDLHILVGDLDVLDVLHIVAGEFEDVGGDVLEDSHQEEGDGCVELTVMQFLKLLE